MNTRFTWALMVGAFALTLGATAAPAARAGVTASLEPAAIAVGESAQLTVTVSGSDAAEPQLRVVDGLQSTPMGQSSSFQSVNGNVTSSVSYVYQVTATRAGTFTIPAIEVPGVGSSRPLQLQASTSPTGAATASPSNLPPPNVQAGTAEGAASDSDRPAFLRVVLPTKRFVVGQRVPVQIRAFFRAGMSASLTGLPTLSSDAFTLNRLDDKPDQSQEMVGGRPFTVVTWTTALSAVKSGEYSVTLELPVVVQVKAKARHRMDDDSPADPFGGSGFDDPLFDDFFGRVTRKQVTLRADLADVKVAPLPADGRPADFTGAVGRFHVAAQAAPTRLTAGDPVTVRVAVTGQGNFDRVSSNGVAGSPDWKTYPTRAQFDPADNAGYGGTKTFEQAVVPLRGGHQQLPAVRFSYFDPDKGQYVTEATAPVDLDVATGTGSTPAAAAHGAQPQETPASPGPQDLVPNDVEAGDFVPTLRPVVFAPWFIASQGGMVLTLTCAVLLHRRRQRLAIDADRVRSRAADAAVRKQRATMERALAADSAPAFFTAARQAVQEELGRQWHLPASEVTSAEIDHRLNGTGAALRDLFDIADGVVYSGRPMPAAELKRWGQTVVQQLKELEQR
jgi:hypothetical protein